MCKSFFYAKNQERRSKMGRRTYRDGKIVMSELEMLFAEEYIKNGRNGTKAYKVVKPNVSMDTARKTASKVLNRPHVRQYINDLLTEIHNQNMADITEVKEYLTNIMRDANEKTADRNRAAELLLKVEGGFDDKPHIDTTVRLELTGDTKSWAK